MSRTAPHACSTGKVSVYVLSYIHVPTYLLHRRPSLANFGLTEQFPNLPQYKQLLPPTIEVIGDLAHL